MQMGNLFHMCTDSVEEEKIVLYTDIGNHYADNGSYYTTTCLMLPNCALKMVTLHAIHIHT